MTSEIHENTKMLGITIILTSSHINRIEFSNLRCTTVAVAVEEADGAGALLVDDLDAVVGFLLDLEEAATSIFIITEILKDSS